MASPRARTLPVSTKRKHRYADLPPHAEATYKVAHGVDVKLSVFPAFGYAGPPVPASRRGFIGGAPWVLWFHGGGFFLGHHVAPYPWVLPSFLSRGYHVVSASYRLAPHASLRDILEDNADALAFCRVQLPSVLAELAAQLNYSAAGALVDVDTYVLGGDSAGGILALLGGHLFSPLPTAIIQSCCVTDMTAYHPTPPSAYPLSGKFSPEALHAVIAERDPRNAVIASPYLSEIPPPLGMARLPRAYLDPVWGPSAATHTGERGTEPDYTPEEMLWTARQNDLANMALRECLTLLTIYRREKFATQEEFMAEVTSLCPLHLLGVPGSRATASAKTYPPSFHMYGTVDGGVPHHHSARFVARLMEVGRPVAIRYAQGKGHAFDIWIGPGSPLWDIVHEGVEYVDEFVRAKCDAVERAGSAGKETLARL